MNLESKIIANIISSLVVVRYRRFPTKLLKCVSSTIFSLAYLFWKIITLFFLIDFNSQKIMQQSHVTHFIFFSLFPL